MNFHTMTPEEAIKYISGQRHDNTLKNCLHQKKRRSILSRFFAQFSDFMIVILLIAAGVSLAISLISKDGDFLDPIIILVIVILNAILGVVEETKADNALLALKKMSAPKAFLLLHPRTGCGNQYSFHHLLCMLH